MSIVVFLYRIVLIIIFSLMAEQEPDSSKCVDWSKCVLCDIDHGTGSHTLASNILRFHEIDSLPVTIDIKKLDDGDGIASTFTKRSAKWHKTCYNKFISTCSKKKKS